MPPNGPCNGWAGNESISAIKWTSYLVYFIPFMCSYLYAMHTFYRKGAVGFTNIATLCCWQYRHCNAIPVETLLASLTRLARLIIPQYRQMRRILLSALMYFHLAEVWQALGVLDKLLPCLTGGNVAHSTSDTTYNLLCRYHY